jgi:hypothetical protein
MTTNDVGMFNVVKFDMLSKLCQKNIFTYQHRDILGVCYYYNVAKGGLSNSVHLQACHLFTPRTRTVEAHL